MIKKSDSYPVLVLGILVAIAAVPAAVHAEETRATYPESVNIEVLGRGVEYSVQVERMATEDIGGGIGIGSVGTKDPYGFGSPSTVVIPVYLNVYLARDQNSLFITGGATLFTNSDVEGLKASVGNLVFPNSQVLPNFGVGFESRSDNGFLLRATAYGLVGATVVPWAGVTLGYAF